MKTRLCILIVICTCAVAGQEQKSKREPTRVIHEPPYYYKAESFLDLNEADRLVYTSGLMDGFYASAFFGANEETVKNLTSCTKDMDSKQVSAIITKYVKDHPESWHLPLSIQAFNALNIACPGGLKIVY